MDTAQLATENTGLPDDFFAGLSESPIAPSEVTTVPSGVYGPLLPNEQYSPVAPDIGATMAGAGSAPIPTSRSGPSAPTVPLWSSILGFVGLGAQTAAAVQKSTSTQNAGSQRPAATTAKASISSGTILAGGVVLLLAIVFLGRRSA